MKENHQRHNEMLCKKTATYTTIDRIVNNKNPANKTYVQEHHASHTYKIQRQTFQQPLFRTRLTVMRKLLLKTNITNCKRYYEVFKQQAKNFVTQLSERQK